MSDNQQLCESNKPLPVRERLWSPGVSIKQARRAETASDAGYKLPEKKHGRDLYTAKVFQCDQVNQNRRVYPRAVMQANIDRIKKAALLAAGMITGAVDHLGYQAGGNLLDTCIIYRDLWIDDEGAGWGKFEIVAGTKAGDHLLALRKAGMAIGKSTYGYGTSHEPSEAEIAKYGDGRGAFVVMDDNYTLKKIDAVDDPAVIDAWDEASTQLAVAESTNGPRALEGFGPAHASDRGPAAPPLFDALYEFRSEGEILHDLLGLSLYGFALGSAESTRAINAHRANTSAFAG